MQYVNLKVGCICRAREKFGQSFSRGVWDRITVSQLHGNPYSCSSSYWKRRVRGISCHSNAAYHPCVPVSCVKDSITQIWCQGKFFKISIPNLFEVYFMFFNKLFFYSMYCFLLNYYFPFHWQVRRLGGAYGGKFSHAIHANAVIAVCANKFNRPVKMAMEMKTNMETYGKRCPYLVKWKVSVLIY